MDFILNTKFIVGLVVGILLYHFLWSRMSKGGSNA